MMKNKKIRTLLCTACALSTLLTACAQPSKPAPAASNPPASSSAPTPSPTLTPAPPKEVTLEITESAPVAMQEMAKIGYLFPNWYQPSLPDGEWKTLLDGAHYGVLGGLVPYYDKTGTLIVANDKLETVYTVPAALAAEYGVNGYLAFMDMNYYGDNLWSIAFNQYVSGERINRTLFFNERGETLLDTPYATSGGTEFPNELGDGFMYAYLHEGSTEDVQGYLAIDGTFLENTMQVTTPRTDSAGTLTTYAAGPHFFDGGLGRTANGYINAKGELVIDVRKLEGLNAGVQEGDDCGYYLWSFRGDTAVIGVYYTAVGCLDEAVAKEKGDKAILEDKHGDTHSHYYEIDRQGNVLGELSPDDPRIPLDRTFEEWQAADIKEYEDREARLGATYNPDFMQGAFEVGEQSGKITITTPGGVQVSAPEGYHFDEPDSYRPIMQWNENFAVVRVCHTDNPDSYANPSYMLLDASGKFYPDDDWQYVYPTADGGMIVETKLGDADYILKRVDVAVQ